MGRLDRLSALDVGIESSVTSVPSPHLGRCLNPIEFLSGWNTEQKPLPKEYIAYNSGELTGWQVSVTNCERVMVTPFLLGGGGLLAVAQES